MDVFQPASLSGIILKNRIIRSATAEKLTNHNGEPLPQLGHLYKKLSDGGVGAIITGYVSIQEDAKMFRDMPVLDNEKKVEAFKKISTATGDTPIIIQLVHCGGYANPVLNGKECSAPSKNKFQFELVATARELTEPEIEIIINNFVKSIELAKKSEFNGVQLHAGHGYLLYEFLSPYFNRRTDKWGGNSKNRFRIIDEIIKRARIKVGNYPIWAKLSAYDFDKGGMKIYESIQIAKMMQKSGFDAIEVSCGSLNDGLNTVRVPKVPVDWMFKSFPTLNKLPGIKKTIVKLMVRLFVKAYTPIENYNVWASQAIKKNVDIPVIVVGGIRKMQDITNIITEKKSDFVSMCRPFIIEPTIVNKFKQGKQEASKCINCGFCGFDLKKSVYCYYGTIPE